MTDKTAKPQRALWTKKCASTFSANRFASVILIFGLSLTAITAQPFEQLATYRYHYHLPSDFNEPQSAMAESFSLKQHTLDFLLPIPVTIGNRQSLILTGANYNNFRFLSSTEDQSVNSDFDRLSFRLGMIYQWKHEKHKTLFIGIPTWSTDGKLFDPDAFQMGGLVLHSYIVKDNLTLKGGLYYNREFFGNFFMPLFGIDWRLPKGWYIFGVLPGTFNVYKQVNSWFAFSLSERAPTGSLLHTGGPGDYVGFGTGVYTLWTLDAHFTPFKLRFADNDSDVTFTFSFGHTFDRNYKLLLQGNEQIEWGPFYDSKDGFYIRAGVSFRVWDKGAGRVVGSR